ncbi:MAG: S8 family serine peptidase [Acidobacteriota bacterium]
MPDVRAQEITCSDGAFSQALDYSGAQEVDGLRLAVAGPRSVGDVYVDPEGPLGSPEVSMAPDSTSRFRLQGASLAGGKRVSLAFCFSGTEVAPVPVGPDAAVAWTIDGEVEIDSEETSKTPAAAAVGIRWSSVDLRNGSWTVSAELANMGFEDVVLESLDWARLDKAPPLAQLFWSGAFPWQSLISNREDLLGRGDEAPRYSAHALPGQWATQASDVVLLRYRAAPKDRPTEVVEGVAQLTVASLLHPRFLKGRALAEVSASTGSPVAELEVATSSQVAFALSGVEAFAFKVTDSGGLVTSVALDAGGQSVDLDALASAEQALYDTTYGRLDPALAEALAGAGPSDAIPVLVWAHMPQDAAAGAPARPDPSQQTSQAEIDLLYAQVDAYWGAVYGEAVAPVLAFLSGLRVEGVNVSTSSPVVHVDLLPSQIHELAALTEVHRLYLGHVYEDFLAVAGPTVKADIVHGQGFEGQGTRLAQVEISGGVPPANPYLQNHTNGTICGVGSTVVQDPNACLGDHATAVAGMIASTHSSDTGIAPQSCLYAAGSCSNQDIQLQQASDRARDWGARAINLSWGSYIGTAPGPMDRFFDNMVINHLRSVVVAAGNGAWPCPPFNGITGSPARAYGVITVGNFDDKNTTLLGDDTMGFCSSWDDPSSQHGDREKPDLAAPGTNFDSTWTTWPWNGDVGTGTSYAAPVVTGAAGLLFQQNSTLAAWPDATKAILMASATHNVEGPARLSEHDGAGGVQLDEALEVGDDQWGGQTYHCGSPTLLPVETIYLQQYRRTRVVLSWSTPGDYPQHAIRPSADLDLQVLDSGNNIVAESLSRDNTFEIVDFLPEESGFYTIRVQKVRCDDSPRTIGWAWRESEHGSYEIPGLGWEAEGAGMDIYDINQNGSPDLLLMVYDAPSTANNFRYKIGWDLDADGAATGGWTNFYNPPGVGWLGQGADGQLLNLDTNPAPELVLMAYDAPTGANNFRYLVGWNLSTGGVVSSWSSYPQLSGLGWQGQGAGIETLQLGGSSRPDLLYMTYDNPAGANNFRYRFGLDLDTAGQIGGATLSCPQVNGVGWEAQGAGVAIGNVSGGPDQDLLFMAYDNASGANTFRYRIGTDLTSACAASWGPMVVINGVGWEGDGAEPELYDIDQDGQLELFLMAYDDPWGGNTFRYRVIDP